MPDDGNPPHVVRQDGQLQGLLIELLRDAAQCAGVELEFMYLPELRSLHMLDSGKIDGCMKSPGWSEQPDNYL